jgi:tRNA nucleotidyltransferase/poly(A) polymerase
MNEKEIAMQICHILQSAGHEAVIAGGAVRDFLLGHTPHDFDVATSADPHDTLHLMYTNGFNVKSVGAAFVVVIACKDGIDTEIAQFRTDSEYLDGRHPVSVKPSDIRGDANRRDLTINAMFMNPETNEIFDFVGGQSDLQNSIIRMVGNAQERIAEDKLRMLRVVRFALKFGFTIEPETLAAIKLHAPDIHQVSAERIKMEIDKMFVLGKAIAWFDLMVETGLMQEVLPEAMALFGIEQSIEHHPEGATVRKIIYLE